MEINNTVQVKSCIWDTTRQAQSLVFIEVY